MLKVSSKMSRFADLSEGDIEILENNSKNLNTGRSTQTWLNVFNEWSTLRGYTNTICHYEPIQLNNILCSFYAEVRKRDGDDYEPDCLAVMQASLDRYSPLSNKRAGTLINF